MPATATRNPAPAEQPALVGPTYEELTTRADRMQRRLEQIYGPEKVVAWLEEGEPLPDVRPDPLGTIRYRAKIRGLTVMAKDGKPSMLRVGLVSRLRASPIADISELGESGEMDVRISPRAIQPGLPMAFGKAAPLGDDVESNVPDEVLQARLTALSSRTGQLPTGWEDWDQDRKDQVARWAWAMMLSASDNAIKIPDAPYDVEEWYWGPEAMAARAASANGTNGSTNADWSGERPPTLRDEDAEAIRARLASAIDDDEEDEDQSSEPEAAAPPPTPRRRASRRRNGRAN